MIINTKDIERLLRMPIPDLTLERETGVARQTIFNARKGNSSLDKMWLGTAIKLQKWVDENLSITFDNSDLYKEAQEDYDEFGDDQVLAVLTNIDGHDFITDYVVKTDGTFSHLINGDKLEVMMMSELVNRLKKQTELI